MEESKWHEMVIYLYQRLSILRKTIVGYLNSFDNIILNKIIFKQSIFIFDRTNNMQFSKMQNNGYDTVPHQMYQPSLSNVHKQNLSVFILCYNLYLVIAYALIPTTDMLSHPFFQ